MASIPEHEPLLGEAPESNTTTIDDIRPLHHNFITGTAIVAQFGVFILAALVWSGIFSHPLIFFSSHPLLNSAGVVLAVQAVLILQPTSHTNPSQKRLGTYIHAGFVAFAAISLLAGFIIIEINKADHGGHFESPHAILGLISYIFLLIQTIVGATQYFYPQIYGSEDKAKSIYKYHRMSGYVVIALLTATISAATWTDYNVFVLKIHHWSVITASVILLGGLYARINIHKFGF